MVRIHRDKALKALETMASGGTVREAQRATSLSFTQLKELSRILPLYVDVKELEEVLVKLREKYNLKIKEFEELKKSIEKLGEERRRLSREIRRLKHEKELLEGGGGRA
ncbi:hypothetical protein apy_14500 [Aeropyrum pernix]|uniref:Uncharacterized protein n=2 Tax=Aeropyrum pernix TaxID=56636 RepID=A0A401HBA7_AERPX|nr:hypothetical protein apy_14500 [Aeropyrum pernix]